MKLENIEKANILNNTLTHLRRQITTLEKANSLNCINITRDTELSVKFVDFIVLKTLALDNMRKEESRLILEIESL